MEELRHNALAGLKAGKAVDVLKQEVTMDACKEWQQNAEWLPLNIEGTASYLTLNGKVK